MSDKEGGGAQADADAQSQADKTGNQQSQADLKTVKDLPDWAQKEIRDARKEAADFRTKLQKIEDSNKTDAEKLTARLEALEKDNQTKAAAIQERDAKDRVRDLAKKAGAPDVDLVYRVIRGDIEFADGDPKNIDALIADLKQTTPHLFKAATTRVDGGSGNGSKPKNEDMNAMIRRAAGVAE